MLGLQENNVLLQEVETTMVLSSCLKGCVEGAHTVPIELVITLSYDPFLAISM